MKHIAGSLILGTGSLVLMPMAQADTPKSIADAHLQRCAKPVFYAQTANHKKEVEICVITPSVSYSFGKVGALHKEMDLIVPAENTTYAYQNNQVVSVQSFTVKNGNIRYEIFAGTNDDGGSFASLNVYQGTPEKGKRLAEIKLDPNTVVSNISQALWKEGIVESDSL
ncbi:conserved exported hypothetical protein [Enterobacterales bacterium 8AC]|nr:conserved exported hypothetical protein [Enterobacterales bacterium 8AC]